MNHGRDALSGAVGIILYGNANKEIVFVPEISSPFKRTLHNLLLFQLSGFRFILLYKG